MKTISCNKLCVELSCFLNGPLPASFSFALLLSKLRVGSIRRKC